LYQIWKFILPALYPKEKKFLLPLVIFSFLLFIVGTGFGLFVLLPIITKFLINIGTTHLVEPYLSISKFISYVFRLIISCGLSFELPIVLIFLTKVGIVSYYQLKKLRRYVILIIFIVAAIITPPDVISQLILALPMLILYELSLLIIKITH
jgi:sec-independent protein translocase protein TatC